MWRATVTATGDAIAGRSRTEMNDMLTCGMVRGLVEMDPATGRERSAMVAASVPEGRLYAELWANYGLMSEVFVVDGGTTAYHAGQRIRVASRDLTLIAPYTRHPSE
jgi:hypothetical protein